MPAISGLIQGGPVGSDHLMELSEPSPLRPGQYRSVQITLADFATWVLALFAQDSVEFRWVGSRLDYRNPGEDWTLGPNLLGPIGPQGPIPGHRWTGTKLQLQNPDGSYTETPVELVGAPGDLSKVTADGLYRKLSDKVAYTEVSVPVSSGTAPAYPNAGWIQGPTVSDALNQIVAQLVSILAPKADPTFSGIPKVPTATAGDSSKQAASTEFVKTAIDANNAGSEQARLLKKYAKSRATFL